jgi:hypothetical protein
MGSDFAHKLQLTSVVLGCSGRKELCARFRAVNSATHFDLERSHKWLQGRALPRSRQVYDDWAKVLGTTKSGAWLASCTMEAFLAEISALYDADPATLRSRVEEEQTNGPTRQPWRDLALGYLCGTYACYSMAWSPYYRRQIIRGSLQLSPGNKASPLLAKYTESLLGKDVLFSGEAVHAQRTLHFIVRAEGDTLPLFLSLFLPGPPGSVFCGVMSGATFVGPEPRPSSTRMVIVRVPANAASSNRYMPLEPAMITADLGTFDLRLEDLPKAATLMHDFLVGAGQEGEILEATATAQARLASIFDMAYLSD